MMILTITLILILCAVLAAVESRDLLYSVYALAAAGVFLCAAFFMLGAPEIALVQMIVECILLAVLVKSTDRSSRKEKYKGRDLFAYLTSIVFVAVILKVFYDAMGGLPEFGSPILKVGRSYREADILLAAAAIFASVIGAFAILRPQASKGPGEKDGTDV